MADKIEVVFGPGPVKQVPEGLTVREAAAYLLRPGIDEGLKKLLEEIHLAGEQYVRDGVDPEFTVLVNGEKASFSTVLNQDSEIKLKK